MKTILIKNRHAGKMFNAVNDLVQNPTKIMICSDNAKKEYQRLYPYVAKQFKTWKEVNKKVLNIPVEFKGI